MSKKTTQDWDDIVEQYKASNLSVAAFCRKHGLTANSLTWHLRKASGKVGPDTHLSIRLDKSRISAQLIIEERNANPGMTYEDCIANIISKAMDGDAFQQITGRTAELEEEIARLNSEVKKLKGERERRKKDDALAARLLARSKSEERDVTLIVSERDAAVTRNKGLEKTVEMLRGKLDHVLQILSN